MKRDRVQRVRSGSSDPRAAGDWRLRVGLPLVFLLTGAALLAGATRLVLVEYRDGEGLRERAARQQTATIAIPAQRGSIYDARGRLLAGSKRISSVFVDPAICPDPRYASTSIAPVLGLAPGALERLISENAKRRFVWVKREITEAEERDFAAVRKARGLHCFNIQKETRREYPLGARAANVVGYVGARDAGKDGIELTFDKVLRGHPGKRTVTVDVFRRRVHSDESAYEPARNGNSVVLTLDTFIQAKTEQHLESAVTTHKADWGTAVVMDPHSGEVLAMASYPTFDPSAPIPPGTRAQVSAALERRRNQAVANAYEPGSIFKPFIVGPAFDEQLVRLNEVLRINGPVRMFGRRPIKDTHTHVSLPVYGIISESSNIGMGLIGAMCGNERLYEYVTRFGFGHRTGIELPVEHDGLVHAFRKWTSYSTQSVPIGQELLVTPIQLVSAFSAFCNGGVLYRPRIVRGVLSPDGDVVEDRSNPVVVRRVMSPDAARAVRLRALAETVRTGTGDEAAIPDYQVFGKTGTAQVAGVDGKKGYSAKAYMGSFLGGAPLREPRVVVLVSLFRPKGPSHYGGTVSGPAVGAIIADVLDYLQVPAEPAEPPALPGRPRIRG